MIGLVSGIVKKIWQRKGLLALVAIVGAVFVFLTTCGGLSLLQGLFGDFFAPGPEEEVAPPREEVVLVTPTPTLAVVAEPGSQPGESVDNPIRLGPEERGAAAVEPTATAWPIPVPTGPPVSAKAPLTQGLPPCNSLQIGPTARSLLGAVKVVARGEWPALYARWILSDCSLPGYYQNLEMDELVCSLTNYLGHLNGWPNSGLWQGKPGCFNWDWPGTVGTQVYLFDEAHFLFILGGPQAWSQTLVDGQYSYQYWVEMLGEYQYCLYQGGGIQPVPTLTPAPPKPWPSPVLPQGMEGGPPAVAGGPQTQSPYGYGYSPNCGPWGCYLPWLNY